MIDCIYNSQPAIARITYIDDSIERVFDVEKAFILTLSTIKKIEMQ
jgi:hypothetical protein